MNTKNKPRFGVVLLAISAALALAAPALRAQTATNAPAAPPSFTQSVTGFFTSFGTNTFNNTRGWVETGVAYQNNIDFASQLELGLQIKSTGTNSGLYLISETFNAGIAGTIVSEQIDAGWGLNIKDTRILFFAGGGYDFPNGKLFPSVGGEVQKRLTENTFAFVRLEEQWSGKTSAPVVAIGGGFTF